MSFGTTPVSTTSLSTNQFPVSAVAEPGLAGGNLTALEAGPGTVDSNGNRTAPASMYVKDGNNLTQGAKADTAATDSTSSWSIISLLKGLYAKLAGTLTISGAVTQSGTWTVQPGNTANTTAWKVDGSAVTQPVSGTVTANAGSGTFTNQQSNNTTDYDTGAGTQTMTMFGVALPASGGAVAGGTATNPVRTDPTGSTTQPVSGTVTANAGTNLNTSLLALESGGNLATLAGAISAAKVQANVAQINGVAPTMGNGVSGTGVQRVTIASDSTGVIGATQSGTWTVQPGNTANTTAWIVQDVAATSGGSTASHTMSAASTNATSLKASAGMVYGFSISNGNAAARYFKLYNKASSPTVGTDTPVMTVQVPANATVIRAFPVGLTFATGIAWAATGAITDADTTAIGANDLSVDIDYK